MMVRKLRKLEGRYSLIEGYVCAFEGTPGLWSSVPLLPSCHSLRHTLVSVITRLRPKAVHSVNHETLGTMSSNTSSSELLVLGILTQGKAD